MGRRAREAGLHRVIANGVVALSALAVAGCSGSPGLDRVSPGVALAGDTVQIWGDAVVEPFSVELVSADGRVLATEPLSHLDGAHVAIAVPEAASPGRWTVRLRVGERTVSLKNALTVTDLTPQAVCEAGAVFNTRVALAHQSVRIERFAEAEPEVARDISLQDIRHIEVDSPEDSEGCSVIWLRLTDGRRLAFDQSSSRSLRQRASRLALEVDRPLVSLQDGVVDLAAYGD